MPELQICVAHPPTPDPRVEKLLSRPGRVPLDRSSLSCCARPWAPLGVSSVRNSEYISTVHRPERPHTHARHTQTQTRTHTPSTRTSQPHSTHARTYVRRKRQRSTHTQFRSPHTPAAARTPDPGISSAAQPVARRASTGTYQRAAARATASAREHIHHMLPRRGTASCCSHYLVLPPRLPHLVPPAGDRAELAPRSRAPQARARRKELAPRPTVSPGWSCAAPSSLTPLRRVPYVEPRSRR